jgi:hypothetical protein
MMPRPAVFPEAARTIMLVRSAAADSRKPKARGAEMLTGIEVLFVGAGILVAMWLVVLYGSRYFGPPD